MMMEVDVRCVCMYVCMYICFISMVMDLGTGCGKAGYLSVLGVYVEPGTATAHTQ